MAGDVESRYGTRLIDRFRGVWWGRADTRLRASWRVLLAAPLIMLTQVVAVTVTDAFGLDGMLPTGLLQAGTFAVLLVGWARYVDHRRLENYGLSVSRTWLLDLGVAFGAIVASHALWFGLGTLLGWTSLEPSLAGQRGSAALVLGSAFVALAVNIWVQDTVFFGIVLRSAAEGFHSRALDPRRAVVAGWLVGILFFAGIHDGSVQRLLTLAVAGGLFGLLYVHTGELSLPIGFHLGVNFCGGWLFAPAAVASDRVAVFAVTETLPVVGRVSVGRLPQMAIGSLLVVAWLWWRRGGVGIEPAIARWTGR